jgi:hypothetical protein
VAVNVRNFAGGQVLEIASPNGPVVITPAATHDITAKLMLGVAGGGIELDGSAARRPAPSGLASTVGPLSGATATAALTRIDAFANAARDSLGNLKFADPEDPASPFTAPEPFLTGTGPDKIHAEPAPVGKRIGSLANVRRALDEMAVALGGLSTARWSVRRSGLSLVLTPKFNGPNSGAAAAVTSTGAFNIGLAANIFGTNAGNAAAYSLGATTPVGKQTGGFGGSDGSMPDLPEYSAAFGIIRSELDSFNFLVLPRAEGQTDAQRKGYWGIASALAAERRALLLVDPAEDWGSIAAAEAGRRRPQGRRRDPQQRDLLAEAQDSVAGVANGKAIDPSGSIAG